MIENAFVYFQGVVREVLYDTMRTLVQQRNAYGVFAEFERAMIQERVRAGLEWARAQGKILGRSKVPKTVERTILKARRQGKGILRIAKEVGCGAGTVQRVVTSTA